MTIESDAAEQPDLGTRTLRVVASLALSMFPPLRAKRIVDFVARPLSPLSCPEAIGLARALEGRGTCLSRALAIAARLPGADVVIAIAPPETKGPFAHAWVEYLGRPLRASDATGVEIARIGPESRPRPRPAGDVASKS
jgi:hypothetical protein